MRATHTYAILEISAAAFGEIRSKLLAAGYDHAFHMDGDKIDIDMNGIAVRAAPPIRHPYRHYPPGMGDESRRLHRAYNALVEAQRAGVKNAVEVVRLTDECAAKGIILVPGGEDL